MAYYYNQQFMDTVIGKGASAFDAFYRDTRDNHGKTAILSGQDKIHESIRTILSTREGERFFMPQFGSKLYLTVFENNSMIFRDLVEMYTREALNNWEKRIVVDAVQVEDVNENNVANVVIMYHLTNSNIMGTYIYPFNLSDKGIAQVYDIVSGQGAISYL